VPKFRFSHRAEADLFNIGLYTFRTWAKSKQTAISASLKIVANALVIIPPSAAGVMKFATGCGA